jgi:hypothetical protein
MWGRDREFCEFHGTEGASQGDELLALAKLSGNKDPASWHLWKVLSEDAEGARPDRTTGSNLSGL